MNAKQAFLHAIADPSITTILLTAGGVAFYAEVSAGFSLVAPAVIGAFCFLLAFVSMQTLPVNTGGVLLFALGFVLLIAEVFVTSYGLLTVAAVVALFLGGLFLMDPASTSMQVPLPLLIALVGGVGIVAGSIGYLVWRDRHRHGTSLLTLNGAEATIFSVSGNGGRAYVNGELWQFESTETFAPGDKAQVTGMHGLKVTLTRRT
jgi:membrane-bound serine protease (ClpP class)